MNWTPDQFREYAQRRLKDESRARERMQQAMSIVAPAPLKEAMKPMVGKKVAGSGNRHNPTVVLAFFRHHGLPEPVPEYQFMPERRFRFDWAWPYIGGPHAVVDCKVALEIQGGLFARLPGGHNRGAQIRREHEKRNLAAVRGWRILYCEPETLLTKATVDLVREALAI